MSEVIDVCGTELMIKEFYDQRVVTFHDIDAVHKRPNGTASRNFRKNRKHFIVGTDYFEINQPDEIRRLGFERPQNGTPEKIIFITEQGYLMIVKSFTDDLAWEVQRKLVNAYFKVQRYEKSTLSVENTFKMIELVNNTPSDRLTLVSAILKQAGINVPETQNDSSVKTTTHVCTYADSYGIDDFLKTTDTINRATSDVYQEYLSWCKIQNITPISHITFSKCVNQILGTEIHIAKIAGHSKRIFIRKKVIRT